MRSQGGAWGRALSTEHASQPIRGLPLSHLCPLASISRPLWPWSWDPRAREEQAENAVRRQQRRHSPKGADDFDDEAVSDAVKGKICARIAEADKALVDGADESLQLTAIVSTACVAMKA